MATNYKDYLDEQVKIAENAKANAYASADEQYADAMRVAEANRRQSVIQSGINYQKDMAGYGQSGERLAQSGLTGSGYSDYLRSQAMAQRGSAQAYAGAVYQDAARSAAMERNAALRQADTSYQNYLSEMSGKELNYRNTVYGNLSARAASGDFMDEAALDAAVRATGMSITDDERADLVNTMNRYSNDTKRKDIAELIGMAGSGEYDYETILATARNMGIDESTEMQNGQSGTVYGELKQIYTGQWMQRQLDEYTNGTATREAILGAGGTAEQWGLDADEKARLKAAMDAADKERNTQLYQTWEQIRNNAPDERTLINAAEAAGITEEEHPGWFAEWREDEAQKVSGMTAAINTGTLDGMYKTEEELRAYLSTQGIRGKAQEKLVRAWNDRNTEVQGNNWNAGYNEIMQGAFDGEDNADNVRTVLTNQYGTETADKLMSVYETRRKAIEDEIAKELDGAAKSNYINAVIDATTEGGQIYGMNETQARNILSRYGFDVTQIEEIMTYKRQAKTDANFKNKKDSMNSALQQFALNGYNIDEETLAKAKEQFGLSDDDVDMLRTFNRVYANGDGSDATREQYWTLMENVMNGQYTGKSDKLEKLMKDYNFSDEQIKDIIEENNKVEQSNYDDLMQGVKEGMYYLGSNYYLTRQELAGMSNSMKDKFIAEQGNLALDKLKRFMNEYGDGANDYPDLKEEAIDVIFAGIKTANAQGGIATNVYNEAVRMYNEWKYAFYTRNKRLDEYMPEKTRK